MTTEQRCDKLTTIKKDLKALTKRAGKISPREVAVGVSHRQDVAVYVASEPGRRKQKQVELPRICRVKA